MEQCLLERYCDVEAPRSSHVFTESVQSAHRLPPSSNGDGDTTISAHLQASEV